MNLRYFIGALLTFLPSFPPSYGFVEFEDNRDADDAVYELNGKELCGERVVVEHARGPRRDRDGYGGGYCGGGGRSKCSLLQDTLSPLTPWGEASMWTAHKTVFPPIQVLIHTKFIRIHILEFSRVLYQEYI